MAGSDKTIKSFDFEPGRILARKYEVVRKIGQGWEGEVYLIRERETGIDRAAKFFYPCRNQKNLVLKRYAKKLDCLRQCPIVIHYYTQEQITFRRWPVNFLVSEYVEGEQLESFLAKLPGSRLSPFQGLHLLYNLAKGIEQIHAKREYHGDLHSQNIIVQRYGLSFDLKLIDLFHWSHPRPENIRDDVVDMVKIFYESLGGAKYYAKQPDAVKSICCGLKKNLILKKFKNAQKLREHLETMKWN